MGWMAGEIYMDCGLTKGEEFTCLLPAFSALQMFLRASFMTDILTIVEVFSMKIIQS